MYVFAVGSLLFLTRFCVLCRATITLYSKENKYGAVHIIGLISAKVVYVNCHTFLQKLKKKYALYNVGYRCRQTIGKPQGHIIKQFA